MKTPITYYGGKQSMLRYILKLIPEHNIYVEPFVGGGAVFWSKSKSPVEVINDTNQEVINFYEVAKRQYHLLAEEIRATPHSRQLQKNAQVVYQNPSLFTPMKRAWAFWTLANQSFNSSLESGWKYARSKKVERLIDNKRDAFTEEITRRLSRTQIECSDALHVIKTRDSEQTFFYCDPPYINANMGHYKGYTIHDFISLLDMLSSIKGKFLLSSYPSPILEEYSKKFGWTRMEIPKKLSVLNGKTRVKAEILTANFSFN